jgi:hypothetical protein
MSGKHDEKGKLAYAGSEDSDQSDPSYITTGSNSMDKKKVCSTRRHVLKKVTFGVITISIIFYSFLTNEIPM